MKVIECKKKTINVYDKYIELKMDNGEYIFINEYIFYLEKFQENQEIDEDIIRENFIILKESIIDRLEDNMYCDEFYGLFINAEIDIKEFEKRISHINILNEYIRIINGYLG